MEHESHETIDKLEQEANQLFKLVRTQLTGVLDQLGDDVARNVKKVEQKPLITFTSIFLGGCIAGLFLGRNFRSLKSVNRAPATTKVA